MGWNSGEKLEEHGFKVTRTQSITVEGNCPVCREKIAITADPTEVSNYDCPCGSSTVNLVDGTIDYR